MLKYFILTVPRRPEFGLVRKDPSGATDTFLVGKGLPYGGRLPADPFVQLDHKHKGMKLEDFVENNMQWLIVSEKVCGLLDNETNRCEVYPLKVLDLKGRPVKVPYFFVHPVGTVDCVNLEKSEYRRSAIEPDMIASIQRLVLLQDKIPPDRTLFRLKESPRTYIIRSDLLNKFAEAEVKGIKVLHLDTPVFI
jgi:hypothetical protein